MLKTLAFSEVVRLVKVTANLLTFTNIVKNNKKRNAKNKMSNKNSKLKCKTKCKTKIQN
jgi:hypothetical protein